VSDLVFVNEYIAAATDFEFQMISGGKHHIEGGFFTKNKSVSEIAAQLDVMFNELGVLRKHSLTT